MITNILSQSLTILFFFKRSNIIVYVTQITLQSETLTMASSLFPITRFMLPFTEAAAIFSQFIALPGCKQKCCRLQHNCPSGH